MSKPNASSQPDLEFFILAWAQRQRSTLDELAHRVQLTVSRLLADLRRGNVSEKNIRIIMTSLDVPADQQREFMHQALALRAARLVAVRFGKVEGELRLLRSAVNAFVGRASEAARS